MADLSSLALLHSRPALRLHRPALATYTPSRPSTQWPADMDRTVGPRYPPGSWPACSLNLRCRPGAPRPGSRVLERHGPSTPIPIGPPGACRPRADPLPCDTQRENVWKTFRFTNRTARLSLIWGVLVPVTVFSICQRQDVRRFHTARGRSLGPQLTLGFRTAAQVGPPRREARRAPRPVRQVRDAQVGEGGTRGRRVGPVIQDRVGTF